MLLFCIYCIYNLWKLVYPYKIWDAPVIKSVQVTSGKNKEFTTIDIVRSCKLLRIKRRPHIYMCGVG